MSDERVEVLAVLLRGRKKVELRDFVETPTTPGAEAMIACLQGPWKPVQWPWGQNPWKRPLGAGAMEGASAEQNPWRALCKDWRHLQKSMWVS